MTSRSSSRSRSAHCFASTRPSPLRQLRKAIVASRSVVARQALLTADQVSVKASTVNLQTGERQSTNTFDFTFMTSKPALERYVVPSTYLETLDWLDALRKRQMGLQLRKVRLDCVLTV